jgi:hypothetical protein
LSPHVIDGVFFELTLSSTQLRAESPPLAHEIVQFSA